MSLQDRFDELDSIVMTLDVLLQDVRDKEYYDDLMQIKIKAESEKDELEEQLIKEQEAEEKEQLREYWSSQF